MSYTLPVCTFARSRSQLKGNESSNHPFSGASCYPDAPCREYLPTFPLEYGNSPNVGKYSIHGASGLVLGRVTPINCLIIWLRLFF